MHVRPVVGNVTLLKNNVNVFKNEHFCSLNGDVNSKSHFEIYFQKFAFSDP